MTLTELVEKIESASYGSETLDDLIFEIAQGRTPCWTGPVGGGVFDQPAWFREMPRNVLGASIEIGRAPGFTLSLDTAQTLMEAGWRFSLNGPGSQSQTPHDALCEISIQDNYAWDEKRKTFRTSAKGSTAALALCAAALRARIELRQ